MTKDKKHSGGKLCLRLGLCSQPVFLWFYQLSTVSLMGMVTLVAVETGKIASAQAAILAKWRFDPATNQLEVTLKDGTTPRYFLLTQPTRIVLDLPNTRLDKVANQQNYSGAVRRIRVAQFEEDVTRIVLELSPEVVLAPGLVQVQRVQPQLGKDERWLLRPLIAGKITPAQMQSSLLPSNLPLVGTQQASIVTSPPQGASPVMPSNGVSSTTLPPATFSSPQQQVVNVPPVIIPSRVAPGELGFGTSSTLSSQPTGTLEPRSGPVIVFGEPLPEAKPSFTAPTQSSLPRLQPGELLPEETYTNPITAATPTVVVPELNSQSPDILLPASTQLSLRYAGNATLNLKAGSPQAAELLLEEDMRSPTGKIIAPAGTPVMGRFETDSDGSRFVAQLIALQDRNIPLAAQSDILDGNQAASKSATLQPGQILRIRLTKNLTML